MRPAVFLDRDNTIIHNDGDLGDPSAVVLMKGAAPAIASLRGLGFRVVVVTNQGGVARGKYREEDVHAVHDRISDLVAEQANGAKIDAFYYCPYHPEGEVEQYTREHPSRKPAPGMLLQAAEDLKLDLPVSWMVGDALRDIEAGRAAGTRTILLHGAKPVPPSGGEGEPDFCASGMVEAVRIIAQQRSPESLGEGARPRKPGEPKRRQWDAKRVSQLQHPREPDSASPGDPPGAGAQGQDDSQPDAPGGPGGPLGPGGQADQRGRAPEFRPWSVGQPAADKPIVPTPFRKRFFRDEEDEQASRPAPPTAAGPKPAEPPVAPAPPATPESPGPAAPPDSSSPAPPPTAKPTTKPASEPPPAAPPVITTPPTPTPPPAEASEPDPEPDTGDEADAPKPIGSPPGSAPGSAPGSDKVLRMILQELRGQRGSTGEFSYLTIIAVVLQIVAIICLLGALWMGGADVGLFTRWLGVGLMAQLGVIATLMFGK